MRASRLVVGDEELMVLSVEVPKRPLHERLTPAERHVVIMLLEGLSNDEIARARGTRLRTVANQVAAIFDKLGVSSRGELAAKLLSTATTARCEDTLGRTNG